MKLRDYTVNDCDAVSRLFFETVHSVNAKDYSPEQLSAWVSSAEDFKSRRYDSLLEQRTVVADIGGKVVGFVSIDKSGELDLLFVAKDHQREGIATALCDEVEKAFEIITTYASITARPFFENRGYVVIEEREVERKGVKLRNYKMEKLNKNI